jgi:hypothetical protein
MWPSARSAASTRAVVQEGYGLLLAHLALRTLIHQAALREGLDPDRLSFTGALRVLRRAIPRAQRTRPAGLPLCVPACGVNSPTSGSCAAAHARTRAPSSVR